LDEEIPIPNDAELIEELSNYKLDPYHIRGMIALEKKEEMKERIGRSPDKGDCFVMLAGCWTEIKVAGKHQNRWHTSYRDYKKGEKRSVWAA